MYYEIIVRYSRKLILFIVKVYSNFILNFKLIFIDYMKVGVEHIYWLIYDTLSKLLFINFNSVYNLFFQFYLKPFNYYRYLYITIDTI